LKSPAAARRTPAADLRHGNTQTNVLTIFDQHPSVITTYWMEREVDEILAGLVGSPGGQPIPPVC